MDGPLSCELAVAGFQQSRLSLPHLSSKQSWCKWQCCVVAHLAILCCAPCHLAHRDWHGSAATTCCTPALRSIRAQMSTARMTAQGSGHATSSRPHSAANIKTLRPPCPRTLPNPCRYACLLASLSKRLSHRCATCL